MYLITQVKKNDFPSKGGKYAKTPPLKGLGRVQSIILPSKTEGEDVTSSLVLEACKIACRISILNGETKNLGQAEEVAQDVVPIEEEDLKYYLELVSPLNNQRVRKLLVQRAKTGQQCATTERIFTCHCTDNSVARDTLIHDWSEDKLDKYPCSIHGRELRHIIFTHPCQNGNINVHFTDDCAQVSDDNAPLAPPLPNGKAKTHAHAISSAATLLLQNKNKSVPFMNELIRKISACQVERPLSSESIEERVERVRNEKIVLQEQKRREQLEEYDKLIQETRLHLHSTVPNSEKVENKEDDDEDDDEEEDSLLSSDDEEQESSKEELLVATSENDSLLSRRSIFLSQVDSQTESCFCLFYIELNKSFGANPNVYLLGDFNDWEMDRALKLKKVGSSDRYSVVTRLKPGKYLYKYFVDGQWVADMKKQTILDEKTKIINNVVVVNSTDSDTSDVEETSYESDEDCEEESSVEEESPAEEESPESSVEEEAESSTTEEEESKEDVEEKIPDMSVLVKENHFSPNIVKQFCADFYLVICEPQDEFSFFTKFDCPYVLQWVDESHKSINIFRRYPLHYYTWTLKRKTQQNFQLLATLEALE